jgi:eukaryotic-like serine/threonine-protein kinase
MQNHLKYVGKQLDQFRLDQFLARGAMGLVFKAFDTVLVRTVALKLTPRITPDGLSPQEIATIEEARKRLIQEAKVAGRLSHPNIVTIHSYGETEEFEYICMEYVSGKTLAQILNIEKVLSVEEALYIFEQILLALEAANLEQIVHRDIKPSNIMMTEDRRVKVMDFGIAKLPSLSMTVTGTVLGTPYYMSPEQISGQKIDIRSDLFSVGAVLYESLTGERPFAAENTATLAYKIVQTDPVPAKILNVHIPQEIGNVITKALTKDPAKRYQSPREMLEDLRAAVRKSAPAADMRDATVVAEAPAFEQTVQISREKVEEQVRKTADAAESRKERDTPPPAKESPEKSRPVEDQSVARESKDRAGRVPPARPDVSEKKPTGESAGDRTAPRSARTMDEAATKEEKPAPKADKKAANPVALAAIFLVILGGAVLYYMMQRSALQVVQTIPQQTVRTVPPAVTVPETPKTAPPVQPSPTAEQGKVAADSLILQAKNLWQKNPAEAQRVLEDAVSKDPGNFEANFQLGRMMTFRKDFPAAILQFQKALNINNRSPEAYFNLGYVHLMQGDYDNAIVNYENCWSLSPPFQDEVLTSLGIAYLRKNNPAQAQILLRQALDLNPNNNVARSYMANATSGTASQQATTTTTTIPPSQATTGSPQQAASEEVNIELGQTTQSDTSGNAGVDDLLAQAKTQRDSNPGESERLFREVLSLDPNNFEAMIQIGRFLTLRKEYPAAIQYYQSALQINTEAPEAYFNLGYIYLSQGAYDNARRSYESCLALSPSFKDEVITNLGIIELKKKNTTRARLLFKEALDLNPDNTIARNYLTSLGKVP